jgi:hypothetical protein
VVLQPEQGAEGHLRRRWDVLSRSGRPGGFEGRGRSLSPQAHGRADHRAGLEVRCGPRGLRWGECLTQKAEEWGDTPGGVGWESGEKGGLGLTGGEKGGGRRNILGLDCCLPATFQ